MRLDTRPAQSPTSRRPQAGRISSPIVPPPVWQTGGAEADARHGWGTIASNSHSHSIALHRQVCEKLLQLKVDVPLDDKESI